MPSPLDCRRSYIKGEGRAKMKPTKRGVNVGAPGATNPLRGADRALKKLQGSLKRCTGLWRRKRGAEHDKGKKGARKNGIGFT